MQRIVIAPDSFKGSLTAKEACDAIEKGIKRVSHDANTIKIPMADGGEGTVQSLVDCKNGDIIFTKVLDPLGNEIEAFMGILENRTAIIEMASASGLPLVPVSKRNPLLTTTYGTGQLIKHGLDLGARKFIIGIGGSATVDGGAGMLQALGFRLLNDKGNEIDFGGGALKALKSIDTSSMDPRLEESEFLVACDVTNPLCGENGAAKVYGPQKGATEDMVERLENNLHRFAQITKEHLSKDFSNFPGTGAAGGLGFAFVSFLDAKLQKGTNIVITETNLEDYIKNADLVITGEGKIDGQTIFGKTPIGVSKLAKKYNVPVIVLTGTIDDDISEIYNQGVTSVFSILKSPTTLEYAMENTYSLLSDATERIFRFFINVKP